jgi:nucleotide-binding universal stress UspA family protein
LTTKDVDRPVTSPGTIEIVEGKDGHAHDRCGRARCHSPVDHGWRGRPAEAEAAAQWAVREAELRKDDVLLVNAYQVPLLPRQDKPAAIARGRQERQALLDKVAETLMMPPTMRMERLVEIDSPASALPRLSEQAELTVLGQDHPALSGHMPFGHVASTVASMSRHPVVAVPRGWSAQVGDRRPVAVAVDGLHPSASTLGFAFTEASLRQIPVLVVHSAPLAELSAGEQDARLNLAEILAGWKADDCC